jgi:hypothetical protein
MAPLRAARRAEELVAGSPAKGMAIGAGAVALLWSGTTPEAEDDSPW